MPIIQKNIVTEMESSYLDYAMTVIVARALPDVRDGLKPVHRRILVTMNDLGLRHAAKHRKSAKICGDVSGNYHPHGESIVYPSMVRLAQDFAMRYPLVDGQGNFGSVDGDNPAAMRYTEARMTKIAEEMLKDIEKKTVDFADNYDGTRQEPKVLPTRLPQLILNGTLGIAVGMATNIPPHNLSEVCDGLIALIDKVQINDKNQRLSGYGNEARIDNRQAVTDNDENRLTIESSITIEELMEYVKGPDFPTGAILYGDQGLKDAYSTGRGKIMIRGIAEIIEQKNGQSQIIITEIPYQVNKAELVSKIASLVTEKKITDISDIRDESDRQGIRIVIDLKKTAYPKKILNAIYSQTSLQTAFHFNMLALVNGIEPRVLNLKQILEEFISFRHEIITRRSEFELTQAKDRAHILEGFLKALDIIDQIIEAIRKSQTRELAQKTLTEKFAFSEKQANAILDLRLSNLVALERQKIENEYKSKKEYIIYLEDLLAHPVKILDVIKSETLEIKSEFGKERKTTIKKEEIANFNIEDLVPDEEVLITLTKTGYIKRLPANSYKNQGRGGKGIIGMATKEEDEVEEMLFARTHDTILFFTNLGRVFKSKIYEIPAVSRLSKGIAIPNILSIGPSEKVTAILTISHEIISKFNSQTENEKENLWLIMATEGGSVKKTSLTAFKNIRSTGIAAISLSGSDRLGWVKLITRDDLVIEITQKGQCIIYRESDIRAMGRTASGVRGIKLRSEDKVISTSTIASSELNNYQLITVLENGFGKRSNLNLFDIQKRGGIGIKAANVTEKTGRVIYSQVINNSTVGSIALVSKQGIVIKIDLKAVKMLGRVTQGVTLMKLNPGDKVASVAIVPSEEQVEAD